MASTLGSENNEKKAARGELGLYVNPIFANIGARFKGDP